MGCPRHCIPSEYASEAAPRGSAGVPETPRHDAVLLEGFANERAGQPKASLAEGLADRPWSTHVKASNLDGKVSALSVAEAITGLRQPSMARSCSHRSMVSDAACGWVDSKDLEANQTDGRSDRRLRRSSTTISEIHANPHRMACLMGAPIVLIQNFLRCRTFLLNHVESLPVQLFVFGVVMLDMVIVIISSQTTASAMDSRSIATLEVTVLAILSLDILTRMLAQGITFFKGPSRALNIFEMMVLVLCIIQMLLVESNITASFAWMRTLGRAAKFTRPLILTCQHRHVIIHAAARTAQQKVFDAMVNLLGDCVRVQPNNVKVDPVAGIFSLKRAEIRAETFEDLHGPVTIFGGVVQHFWVQVPIQKQLLGGGSGNKMIKAKLCNAELVLGPVRTVWSYDSVRRCKGKLVELLYRRSDVLAPVLKPKGQQATTQEVPDQAATINVKVSRMEHLKKKLARQLVHHLLHDLSLEISNVCVRFEAGQGEISGLPFVCGVGLRSFSFKGTAPDSGNSGGLFSQVTQDLVIAPASGAHRLLKTVTGAQGAFRSFCSTPANNEDATAPTAPHQSTDGLCQKLVIEQFAIYWDVHHEQSGCLARKTYKDIEELFQSGKSREALQMAAEAQRKFVANRARETVKLGAIRRIIDKFSDDPEKQRLLKGPMFRERFDEHYYVLFPVNATMHVEWRRHAAVFQPPRLVACQVEAVRWAVDDRQLVSMNQTRAHVSRWFVENQCSLTRPAESILTREEVSKIRACKHSRQSLGAVAPADSLTSSIPSADATDNKADIVKAWWKHAMRCCQIRLDLRPRTIGNNMLRDAAEKVQAEYIDLVIQSMLADHLSAESLLRIQKRVLTLQVPLHALLCLRLRQLATDEVRRLKRHAHHYEWLASAKGEVGRADSIKARVSNVIEGVKAFSSRIGGTADLDDVDEEGDEDVDAFFDELVGPRPVEKIPRTILSNHTAREGRHSGEREGAVVVPAAEDVVSCDGESHTESKGEAIDDQAVPTESLIQQKAPIEVTLSVESVEAFVLSHSLWTAILKANTGANVPPRRRSKGFRAARVAPVGGFGFERFGTQVMPRNMVVSAGITAITGRLAIVFDAFDGGSAIGSQARLSVDRVYVYTPTAPAMFRSMLELGSFETSGGKTVAMEMDLLAAEPSASTLGDTSDASSAPENAANLAGGTVGASRGRLPHQACFVERTQTMSSASTAQAPRKPFDGISAAKALLNAHWEGSFHISPMSVTCFEPVLQRVSTMAREGRPHNQAREEFECAVREWHRRATRFRVPDKLFAQLRRFVPGSLSLSGEVGAVEAKAVLRYASREILFWEATLPALLPKLRFGGIPTQMSVDLASDLQQDEQDGIGQMVVPTITAAKNMALQENPPHCNAAPCGGQVMHSVDEIASHAFNLGPPVQQVSSRSSQFLAEASGWRALWCACLNDDTLLQERTSALSDATQADNTMPNVFGRTGGSAVAWAAHLASNAKTKIPPPSGTLGQELTINDDVISWPEVMPLASMMRQLPWSVKVNTIASTTFGLTHGNLAQRAEDYHFLDTKSRTVMRRRNLNNNNRRVSKIITKAASNHVGQPTDGANLAMPTHPPCEAMCKGIEEELELGAAVADPKQDIGAGDGVGIVGETSPRWPARRHPRPSTRTIVSALTDVTGAKSLDMGSFGLPFDKARHHVDPASDFSLSMGDLLREMPVE